MHFTTFTQYLAKTRQAIDIQLSAFGSCSEGPEFKYWLGHRLCWLSVFLLYSVFHSYSNILLQIQPRPSHPTLPHLFLFLLLFLLLLLLLLPANRLQLFRPKFRLTFGHRPARFVTWPVFVLGGLFIVSDYKSKVKWSRYRPGVAQRVGRGIALLFRDRGTRRGWVVSSTPRPLLPPGRTRYPFYRRLGGPQGRSGRAENLVPTGMRPRTVQLRSQSLYRLNYPTYQITKDTSTLRN